MRDSATKVDVLYVAPGTTLFYFTGVHWWPSERILALLIPRTGEPVLVCPAFEEARLREGLRWPITCAHGKRTTIRLGWRRSGWATGVRTGRVGVEQTMFFAFSDGMRRAAPAKEYVSGDPVTVGCRAVKSAHELELMRLACEATCAVYKATFASFREGMTQRDVEGMVSRAYAKMGLRGDASVKFGASSALPHGSREEQMLHEGTSVMIDDGHGGGLPVGRDAHGRARETV